MEATVMEMERAVFTAAASYVQRGWCLGVMARDAIACETEPTADVACSWCLWGACVRALGDAGFGQAHKNYWLVHERLLLAVRLNAAGSIADFNDRSSTKQRVMDLLLRLAQGGAR